VDIFSKCSESAARVRMAREANAYSYYRSS
jgi:hypothetical protein